jgi:hypothetical protein
MVFAKRVRLAALLGAVLMLMFSIYVAFAFEWQETLDCACFGRTSESTVRDVLIRNGILFAALSFVATFHSDRTNTRSHVAPASS